MAFCPQFLFLFLYMSVDHVIALIRWQSLSQPDSSKKNREKSHPQLHFRLGLFRSFSLPRVYLCCHNVLTEITGAPVPPYIRIRTCTSHHHSLHSYSIHLLYQYYTVFSKWKTLKDETE